MIIKYESWLRPPLAHHNWSLSSFWDLCVPYAMKLYSNNKDLSTSGNPLRTNWIISGELQSDLIPLPAVLLTSSVLINVALAISDGLIDISLEPFLFRILTACPIAVRAGLLEGPDWASYWIYCGLQRGLVQNLIKEGWIYAFTLWIPVYKNMVSLNRLRCPRPSGTHTDIRVHASCTLHICSQLEPTICNALRCS